MICSSQFWIVVDLLNAAISPLSLFASFGTIYIVIVLQTMARIIVLEEQQQNKE